MSAVVAVSRDERSSQSPSMPLLATIVLGAVLLLAGCGHMTVVWKTGPTGGNSQSFKRDDYACKRDAEGIRQSASGLAALAEDGRVKKLYIECMESKGYEQ